MECLPSELRQCIVHYLDKKDLIGCALVCKAWLPFVQTLLYTHVHFKRLELLEQFQHTVEKNPQLGEMVQYLEMNINTYENRHIPFEKRLHMVSSTLLVCLPNLEMIRDYENRIYIPVKEALENSQLRSLKRLEVSPSRMKKGTLEAYELCLPLMKYNLENIYVTDHLNEYPIQIDHQLFHRLYSTISQFSQLKKIEIYRETNEPILLLEDILETCPVLEEILWSVIPNDTLQNNSEVSRDSIPKFVPRKNIKSFSTEDEEGSLDEKTLTYLMHKFPHLNQCYLEYVGPVDISQQVFEQLILYISEIKQADLDIHVTSHDLIVKTIGVLWKNTSAYGKEDITFQYSKSQYDFPKQELLGKNKLSLCAQNGRNEVSIKYPFPSTSNHWDWKHVEFMKKNGKFLKRVEFHFILDYYSKSPSLGMKLPEDIIALTFAYCPYIQELSFDDCIPRALNALPSKKFSLNELSFFNDTLKSDVGESLSTVLSEVKHLRLYQSGSINMPYTKIEQISFEWCFERRFYSQPVKITDTIDGKSYYYTIDSDKKDVLPSTEEEYKTDDPYNIEICCRSCPIIKCSLTDSGVPLFYG